MYLFFAVVLTLQDAFFFIEFFNALAVILAVVIFPVLAAPAQSEFFFIEHIKYSFSQSARPSRATSEQRDRREAALALSIRNIFLPVDNSIIPVGNFVKPFSKIFLTLANFFDIVIMTKALGGDIINNRLKEIRKAKGLSGAEFGQRIGVAASAISRWESGERKPPNSTILSICREFGVNEVWLRTGEGEPFLYTSREAELGALVRSRLVNRPESFQRALITVLLRFDPEGPEWAIIERIYENLAAELPDPPDADLTDPHDP